MSDDFLSRWSRRKLASKAGPDRPTADAIPAKAGIQSPPSAKAQSPNAPAKAQSSGAPPSPLAPQPPAPLPPVESLTPESDFTPFMRSDIDPGLRRQALRTLFRDPRFNVMDGLDVYIDDYSKPDPIPPEWLEHLTARLGDYLPPKEDAAETGEAASDVARQEIPAEPAGIKDASEAAPADGSDTSAAVPPPPESRQS